MEVFHRVAKSASLSQDHAESFWLLLHPMQHSKCDALVKTVCSSEQASDITNKPMRMHLQLLSAHIDTWRSYLDHEGQIYQDKVRKCAPLIMGMTNTIL
jgi:hypothetical protein